MFNFEKEFNSEQEEIDEAKISKEMNFDIDQEIPISERPKKILEFIVEHRKDSLVDLDANIEELQKIGIKKEEIEITIKLMCAMSYFDSIFFKKGVEMNFSLYDEPDLYAGYHSKEGEEDNEAYHIFVKRISDKIKERNKNCVSFDSLNKLNFVENTEEEFILSVAAHEVRHRLQKSDEQKNKIELFDRNKEYPKNINNFVEFERLFFEEEEKVRSEEYIKGRLSDLEFDARVVESIFEDALRKGESIKELCEIIKLKG